MNLSLPAFIEKRSSFNPFVISVTLLFVVALVAMILIAPERTQVLLDATKAGIFEHFSWFYVLAFSIFICFLVILSVSSLGSIKLGNDEEEPEFGVLSWLAMLFAAGMGVGLMFFGVAEPLSHYLSDITVGAPEQREQQALLHSMFHWGIHAWGVYGMIALALAYFGFRYKLPLALRSCFYPLFKERINGRLGDAIDIMALLATLFGIITTLGFGATQMGAGLEQLGWISENTFTLRIVIIAVVMALAIASAISGVGKGVKLLSEINLCLALALLVFVLATGPTLHLLAAFSDNIGTYASNILQLSFKTYTYEHEHTEWFTGWTILYWAWWCSWAPFVGLFIARISRGRTLREFVFGVMFIPLGFIFAWFSIFGNSGIFHAATDPALAKTAIETPAMGLFALFEHYAHPAIWSSVSVIIGLIFFVTSADSGALVLANLSSKGLSSGDDAPIWLRLFWAAATGLITLGLLFSGGFSALQSVSVAAGLPFSLVLFIYMVAMAYSLRQEGNRRKASTFDMAPPALNPQHSWRDRLNRILNFPTRKAVLRFMSGTLEPAMQDVCAELNKQGVQTTVIRNEEDQSLTFEVLHGEEVDFLYQVKPVSALMPVFAMNQASNLDSDKHHERYWRAEVFLREGSQEYDLVGYTRDQIIGDILNQYERHMQFLHLER